MLSDVTSGVIIRATGAAESDCIIGVADVLNGRSGLAAAGDFQSVVGIQGFIHCKFKHRARWHGHDNREASLVAVVVR